MFTCILLLQQKYSFRHILIVGDCTGHLGISKQKFHHLTMSFNYGINLQSLVEYMCKVSERIKGLQRIKTTHNTKGTSCLSEQ